jgi:hypothetical protein
MMKTLKRAFVAFTALSIATMSIGTLDLNVKGSEKIANAEYETEYATEDYDSYEESENKGTEGADTVFTIGSVTAQAGTTVSVPVTVSPNAGFYTTGIMYSYSSEIVFDGENPGNMRAGSLVDSVSSSGVAVVSASASPVTSTGTLYTLEFAIPDDAQSGTVYPITGSINLFSDLDNNDTDDFYIIDGSITVSDVEETEAEYASEAYYESSEAVTEEIDEYAASTVFKIGSVIAQAGSTVSVPVQVLQNAGFCGTGIMYTYDPDIAYDGVYSGNIKAGEPSEATMSNSVALTTATSSAVTSTGTLYTLEFTIPDNAEVGTVYPITGSVSLLSDSDNKETYDYYLVDGSITVTDEVNKGTEGASTVFTIGSVIAQPGTTVSVPVTVSSNAGFTGTGFQYYYNSNITYDGFYSGDIDVGSTVDSTSSNAIAITTASARTVTSVGTIYYLEFTIPSDAKIGAFYPITGSVVLLADSDSNITDDFYLIDGGITIDHEEDTKEYSGNYYYENTIKNENKGTPGADTIFTIDTVTVEPGTTKVSVPVTVSPNAGFTGTGIQYYYNSAIECDGAYTGDIKAVRPNIATSSGTVAVTTGAPSTVTSEGTIYTLEFTIPVNSQPGTFYAIEGSVSLVADSDQKETDDFYLIDGGIIIADEEETESEYESESYYESESDEYYYEESTASAYEDDTPSKGTEDANTVFTISSIVVQPGTTRVSVPVIVSPNAGFCGTGILYSFDSDLTYVQANAGDIRSGEPVEVTALGRVAITTAAASAVTSEGTIYTLEFTIPSDAEPGTFYAINGSVAVLSDEDNKETHDFYLIDGGITIAGEGEIDEYDASTIFTIDTVTVQPGTTRVFVPVIVSPNAGFTGTGIKYTYDSDITYYDVYSGDIRAGDPVEATAPGVVAITTGAVNAVTSEGTLYTLEFTIPSDAKAGTFYAIEGSMSLLSDADNYETDDFYIVDGGIIIADEEESESESESYYEPETESYYYEETTAEEYTPNKGTPGANTVFTIDTVTVQPGTTRVSVPVIVSPNAGFTGTGIKYTYDSDITYYDVYSGDIDVGYMGDATSLGVVAIATVADGNVVTSEGTVYTLEFTIPSDAEAGTFYAIEGSMSLLSDADNYETDDFYLVDGGIIIADEEEIDEYDASTIFTIDTVTVQPGTTRVSVPVMVSPNAGFSGTGIKYTYDSAITYYDVYSGDIKAGEPVEETASNSVAIATAAVSAVTSEGTLYTLEFTIPSDAKAGTFYAIEGSMSLLSDSDNKETDDFYLVDGGIIIADEEESESEYESEANANNDLLTTFSVGSVTVKPGTTKVSVPVIVSPNAGFCGTGIKYTYDSAIKFNEVYSGDIKAGEPVEEIASNSVAIATGAAKAVTSEGTIYTLEFTIPADAESGTVYQIVGNVALLSDSDNNETYNYKFINGSITVLGDKTDTSESESKTTTTSTTKVTTKTTTTKTTIKATATIQYFSSVEMDWNKFSVIDSNKKVVAGVEFRYNGNKVSGPDNVYISGTYKYNLDMYKDGTKIGTTTAYIGVKGDCTLDGNINSNDAVQILKAYARTLVKQSYSFSNDNNLNTLAMYLGDIDTETSEMSKLNSKDAVYMLNYYAKTLAKQNPKWNYFVNSLSGKNY